MADDQGTPIDPALVPHLQKSRVLDELWNDPKTHDAAVDLLRTKYPDLRHPELDAKDREKAMADRLDKRFEEREKLWAEREIKLKREESLAKMTAKGVGAEEVEAVEKLMAEAQIGDPEAAAELYVTRRAAAAPRSAPSFTFDMPDQKELFGSPGQRKNWARKMAAQTLHELRGGR